jgi:hypothetical protein
LAKSAYKPRKPSADERRSRTNNESKRVREEALGRVDASVADLKKAVSAFGKDMGGIVDQIKGLEEQLSRLKAGGEETAPVKQIIPEPRTEVVLFPANPAKVCQRCLKERATTRSRSIYTKDYQGPCGDSFCYASCEMSSCRPVDLVACDDCAKALSSKDGPGWKVPVR